jgi:hypothetical protein
MSLPGGQDRDALRQQWRSAWQRHLKHLPLTPLQSQLVALIEVHPEHLPYLQTHSSTATGAQESAAAREAFLHLGLHMALREQVATDRPQGIALIHRRLIVQLRDAHQAEHRMMGALEQALWQAQREGRLADDAAYVEALQRL